MAERGITLPPSNRLQRAVERIATVNADPRLLQTMPDADAELLLHASRDVFEAFLVMWTAVERMKYSSLFPSDKLKTFLDGADSPQLDANVNARNFQFELVVGAHFALGDADIKPVEPDYSLKYEGRQHGLAVKRLTSVAANALESRLRDGANQVAANQGVGFVAVNLDGWITDLSGADPDTVGKQFETQLTNAYKRIAKVAKLKSCVMGVFVFGTWLRWIRQEGRRTLQWRNPFQFIGFGDKPEDEAAFNRYFSNLRERWEASMATLAPLLQAAA